MCNTNLMQNRHLTMGFAGEGLWGMGYDGLMGYGMQIPAYQLGGLTFQWGIRGYGLSTLWFKRGSTVIHKQAVAWAVILAAALISNHLSFI